LHDRRNRASARAAPSLSGRLVEIAVDTHAGDLLGQTGSHVSVTLPGSPASTTKAKILPPTLQTATSSPNG
jgi:hypothetical protein